MPRGVPKSGTRTPGAGRRKTYAGKLVQKWVPLTVANNLDDLYRLLVKLEKTVSGWETICEQKSTSPRYEQARKLTKALRTMIDKVGINPDDIYVSNQYDNNEEKQP